MTELVLTDGAGCVNFVAEDEEGNLGEVLDREERVQLGLGLGEALKVGGIDEEDDAIDLGEVVTPEPAGYRKVRKEPISVMLSTIE
jgi:hypothetical protein